MESMWKYSDIKNLQNRRKHEHIFAINKRSKTGNIKLGEYNIIVGERKQTFFLPR